MSWEEETSDFKLLNKYYTKHELIVMVIQLKQRIWINERIKRELE